MHGRLFFVSSAIVVMFNACAGHGSGPSTVPRLAVGCGMELDGYRCSASTAGRGGMLADVTGLATWSTSDASIATVNSVGFVTVIQAGDVSIRASYADEVGYITLHVEAGGLRRYYRTLSGFVKDAATEQRLGGATVEVRGGANAGRSTVGREDGSYQLDDLQPETLVVRFTKTGYADAEYTFDLPGNTLNSLDARLTKVR